MEKRPLGFEIFDSLFSFIFLAKLPTPCVEKIELNSIPEREETNKKFQIQKFKTSLISR